jgi:rsbT co-antagonist protein RsbR
MADANELRRELARVRERIKQLKDSSSLALIELDTKGSILAWNRMAEAVFGWPEQEVLGRSIDIIVPEQAREHAHAMARALVQGEVRHSRHQNIRKDGELITCQWYSAPIRGEDGQIDLIYCEVRDVTGEEALQQRNKVMQALVAHSPLGIFAKGPDGRYVYANEEFARSVGLTVEEVLGRDDYGIFEREIADSLRRHDADLIATRRLMAREDPGVGPDTGRIYWSLKFPLFTETGETLAVCGMVNDITPIRLDKKERASLQQQIIDYQNLLLAELSTPLIPVAEGVLVMPLIGSIDDARARRIMEALLEGVSRHRARSVILDVTGISVMDGSVAEALIRSARGARLLGAEVLLTGIKPATAQVFAGLGGDLAGLVTLGSLQTAIAYALQRAARGTPGT